MKGSLKALSNYNEIESKLDSIKLLKEMRTLSHSFGSEKIF